MHSAIWGWWYHLSLDCKPPRLALWRMQVPVTMDQVLLDGGGGSSVLLARIRDADGCWLCFREVYTKLSNGMPESTWKQYTHGGAARVLVTCNHKCTCPDARLFWVAGAQGRKPATPEERRFLTATGALLSDRKGAVLISVDMAMCACGKAGLSAPLLAAMAEIAELQRYSTPPLPQAQPKQALTYGVARISLKRCLSW